MATRKSTQADDDRQESHQRYCHFVYIPVEVTLLVKKGVISRAHAYLLSEINGHVDPKGLGCWASNAYLADLCGCTPRQIQYELEKLRELGLVIDSAEKKVLNGEERRTIEAPWSRVDKFYPTKNPSSPPRRILHPENTIEKKSKHPKSRSAPLSDAKRRGRPKIEPSEHHFKWATRLRNVTTKKLGYLKGWSHSSWAHQFRKLEKNIGAKRVERVLTWYEGYARRTGDCYRISTAEAFCARIDTIEGIMSRSPAAPDSAPHPDTQKVIDALGSLKWPKGAGAQLPKLVSRSLKTLHGIGQAIKELVTQSPDVVKKKRLQTMIEDFRFVTSPSYTSFVIKWYREQHEDKAGWEKWSGRLQAITTKADCEFDKFMCGRAVEVSGRPERWQELLEVLDL